MQLMHIAVIIKLFYMKKSAPSIKKCGELGGRKLLPLVNATFGYINKKNALLKNNNNSFIKNI
ncbi:hypothetical protein AH332_16880 [Salmonella enterica subsp. salamae]|nr:hypothetical protein [Salmonella enterica subsp. salamae]